jgi:hypothetical protein
MIGTHKCIRSRLKGAQPGRNMIRNLKCETTIFDMCTRCYLYLIVILVLLVPFSVAPLSSAVADKSELTKLITENEDPLVNVNDLAFLLVTHDFDAVPKKDFVEVHLDNSVYKLVPNGKYPGLANVTVTSR